MPLRRSVHSNAPGQAAPLHRPAAVLTVVVPHTQAGLSVAINPEGTVVGRDATCALVLASTHISRQHAVVRVLDGEYVIEDLGSKNGTLLNGEPVTIPRRLRDGDRLFLADVEVEFRLTGGRPAPPERPQRPGDEAWRPEDPTDPLGTALGRPDRDRPRSLRRELHAAPGFSAGALFLAVAGSAVGTVLSGAAGTGPWGTLAGATLGPVISTTFSTRRAGEKGLVRSAAIAVLSAGALLITVTGFSLADAAAGRSVVPGTDERPGTFPVLNPAEPTGDGGGRDGGGGGGDLGIRVQPPESLDCGEVAAGASAPCPQPVTVTSTGTGQLRITRVEVTGRDDEDFIAGDQCTGARLDTGESCQLTVEFHPSDPGRREATLVVHQNLPAPDRGTEVPLTGTGNPAGAGLTVEVDAGSAAGTVVSDPSGIDCPDTCGAAFATGTTVTLSARFDQGSGSVRWDGCEADGDTCTVRLDEDRTVRATLAP